MHDVEGKHLTGRTWADLTIEAIRFVKTWHISYIIFFAIFAGIVFGLYLYITNFRSMAAEDRYGYQLVAQLQAELKDAEASASELRREISSMKIERSEMKLELDAIMSTRDVQIRRIRDLQAELTTANARLADAEVRPRDPDLKKMQELEARRARIEAERNDLRDRLAVEGEALSKTKSELTDAIRRERTQKEANDKLASQQRTKIQQLNESLKMLQADGERSDDSYSKVLGERDDLQRQLTAASNNVSFWMNQHTEAEQLARSLEAELKQMKEVQSQVTSRAIWGAAALAPDGIIYSIANQLTAQAASDMALLICRGASGRRCILKDTYQRSCFSIARIRDEGARPNNWAFNIASTWREAENKALAACSSVYRRECTTRYTLCSPSELDKPSEESALQPE